MSELIKMKVLVSGLKGVGMETLKNLILAGPASVDIHDDTPVTIRDLGTNFYCNEKHIEDKIPRSKAVID